MLSAGTTTWDLKWFEMPRCTMKKASSNPVPFLFLRSRVGNVLFQHESLYKRTLKEIALYKVQISLYLCILLVYARQFSGKYLDENYTVKSNDTFPILSYSQFGQSCQLQLSWSILVHWSFFKSIWELPCHNDMMISFFFSNWFPNEHLLHYLVSSWIILNASRDSLITKLFPSRHLFTLCQ